MAFLLTLTLQSGAILKHSLRDDPSNVLRDAKRIGSPVATMPLVNGGDLFVCPADISAWSVTTEETKSTVYRLRQMAMQTASRDDAEILRRAASVLEGG